MKEEILWNKHFITISGKSIFYKAWASRGIQILNDLLDSHGVLFHFENLKVIQKGAAYSISTLVISQRFPKIIYCIVMATLDGRPCGNLIFLRLMTPPSVVIRIWFVLQGTLELPSRNSVLLQSVWLAWFDPDFDCDSTSLLWTWCTVGASFSWFLLQCP